MRRIAPFLGCVAFASHRHGSQGSHRHLNCQEASDTTFPFRPVVVLKHTQVDLPNPSEVLAKYLLAFSQSAGLVGTTKSGGGQGSTLPFKSCIVNCAASRADISMGVGDTSKDATSSGTSVQGKTQAAQKNNTMVRFYNLGYGPESSKVLYLVRHAQGTHNVNKEYRKTANRDASLTPLGVSQCSKLADVTRDLQLDLIISSPLTRTLQTATYSFPEALANGIPLLAEESFRETVNYVCDCRRPVSFLRAAFPNVDFSRLEHDEDPIWARYEAILGDSNAFTGHRESADLASIADRCRVGFMLLAARPEKNIAVVSHNAFLTHVFNSPLGGLVDFADSDVKDYLQRPWENCEMRVVEAQFLGVASA